MTKSVMTSDIEVCCHDKQQLKGGIDWLLENNYNFEWDVHQGEIPVLYSLRVPSMSWANNLKEFAAILEKSDFEGF